MPQQTLGVCGRADSWLSAGCPLTALARGVLLLSLSGCTLLSDFDVNACGEGLECSTTVGVPTYCDDGACKPGCRDNRQCAERDPRTPLCTRKGGTCVAIGDPERECYVSSPYDDRTMGDVTAESLTIVGAFAPSLRSSIWLTLELAADEFRASAMPSSARGAAPLMLVLCDDAPDAIRGSVNHLIDDLGVRAIVASFDESIQSDALLAVSDRAFLLSPDGGFGDAPSTAYWHLGGDYGDVVRAYSALLPAIVRRLGQRTAASDRPSRIALLTSSGSGQRLAEQIGATVTVDGRTREELRVLDRFRTFDLSDAERDRSIEELALFAPDLVLLHASGVSGSPPRRERAEVIARLEEDAVSMGRTPPLYAIGPRQAGEAYIDALAASDPSFRARAVLVDLDRPGRDEEVGMRARFTDAYVNPLAEVSLGPAPGVYDALYYLAYAAAAGRDGSALSVASIRGGMDRVSDPAGPAVRLGAGSEGFDLSRDLLGTRAPFNLQGITGNGPFDQTRGLRVRDPVISCWRDDGTATVLGRFNGSAWTVELGLCASEVIDGPFD